MVLSLVKIVLDYDKLSSLFTQLFQDYQTKLTDLIGKNMAMKQARGFDTAAMVAEKW